MQISIQDTDVDECRNQKQRSAEPAGLQIGIPPILGALNHAE